jgi:hypothetical protein
MRYANAVLRILRTRGKLLVGSGVPKSGGDALERVTSFSSDASLLAGSTSGLPGGRKAATVDPRTPSDERNVPGSI